MTHTIQELTEKIYNEGIVKANGEAEIILSEAKKEAEGIINSAREEKKQIIQQATKEAEEVKKKADSEIRLAAQKMISSLKQQVAGLLVAKQVDSVAKEAFEDEKFVREMILLVIQNWQQHNAEESDLSLFIPEKDQTKLSGFFENKLVSQLNKGIEIKIDPALRNGFKIGPKDGNYILSFTEKDFENYFKTYLKEKTWQMAFGSPQID